MDEELTPVEPADEPVEPEQVEPAEAAEPADDADPGDEHGDEAEPGQDDADPDDDDTPAVARLRREAARWRRHAREAEADRDALRGRLDELLAAEVERVAERRPARGPRLAHGSDLLALTPGATVAGFLTEDGQVDAEKVATAVADLLTRRPDLAERMVTGSANGGAAPHTPRPRTPGDILGGALGMR